MFFSVINPTSIHSSDTCYDGVYNFLQKEEKAGTQQALLTADVKTVTCASFIPQNMSDKQKQKLGLIRLSHTNTRSVDTDLR